MQKIAQMQCIDNATPDDQGGPWVDLWMVSRAQICHFAVPCWWQCTDKEGGCWLMQMKLCQGDPIDVSGCIVMSCINWDWSGVAQQMVGQSWSVMTWIFLWHTADILSKAVHESHSIQVTWENHLWERWLRLEWFVSHGSELNLWFLRVTHMI